MSYVILQGKLFLFIKCKSKKYLTLFLGIGIMPLQLLNLGVIIPRFFYRMFYTRTPRGKKNFPPLHIYMGKLIPRIDFAELNAPPMINYGVVYPQAILIFVITILYSVVQPLIVIFGAIYFGIAYVVYKYKLLFGALDTFVFVLSNLILLPHQNKKSFINHTNPKDKHGQSHSYVLFGESSYSSSL